MYSLDAFGSMIKDEVRMSAYFAALQRAIVPGCSVLDLGAGTGVMSLLAAKLGAGRVYAVEPSSLSQLVSRAARDNGVEDKVVVMQVASTQVHLPQRVDVLVSDVRGVLPPFQRNLEDLRDARSRLLAPNGVMIPKRDALMVAVVTAENAFEKSRAVWTSKPFGLDMSSALPLVHNHWAQYRASAAELACEPACWASIDYSTMREARVAGSGSLVISRDCIAHGLLLWFDTVLIDDIGFSNHPAAPRAIYGQAFMPWPRKLSLQRGARVDFDLRADLLPSGYNYTWTTELPEVGPEREPVRFRQSDFLARPFALDTLRRRAAQHVPQLSEDGQLTLQALERMRAGAPLEIIANELRAAAPKRFHTWGAALDFAADLSERFSR